MLDLGDGVKQLVFADDLIIRNRRADDGKDKDYAIIMQRQER